MSFHRQDMFYDNPPHSANPPHRLQNQGSLLYHSPRPVDSAANSIAGYSGSDDPSSRYEQPRFNDRMTAATLHGHGNFGPYDMAQPWNGGAFGGGSMGPLGGTNRMKPPSRGRSALPTGWMDQGHPMPGVSPFLGMGGGHHMGASPVRADTLGSDPDEELIPTAIVIKNIPFAVKKEQLVTIMTELGLPLPYAFNYHFDNGIFRGLAFANFTSAEETATVIDVLNHYELQGRKLRVEYKKMLPAAERERIEREKRERRGQLEEQHRPMAAPTLHTQPSISSLSNIPPTSPSPVSARGAASAVDMNDPETLDFYTKLAVFKERPDEVYMLPPNLTPQQRRIVHTLAHHMGLHHTSKGVGEQRAVHVFKNLPVERLSPPMSQLQGLQSDAQRRTLSRAATTDFNDARGQDTQLYGLRQQGSTGFLPPFQPSAGGLSSSQNLRAAKSFADLRSYTPSPVPSTASFPASLANNAQRVQDQHREATSATTPTMPTAFGGRDDGLLVNGLGNLNLGNGFGNSPRTLRGMMSWERGSNNENLGTIGGHRSFTAIGQFDGQSGDRNQGMPSRQPRGPAPERGTGFPRGRQNGHMSRGSDELSQQSVPVDTNSE
ncbi:hypothetical protein K461DRAFT_264884 [Myriangium duriaei CBS 260.36]|uniref:R3H domain-containing protein n=1 Tax=Myriangium duriaei CBS 260.36 TaxID=1168546 RepID=A0A9P4JFW8_9PEZI|nr:hypothetical protein K461DRAFT_264884 [Myriangium duriaei CBS 260.36]